VTALRIGVTTLATVTRDGSEWVMRHIDIVASVTVPDDAVRDVDRGARCFRWYESPHAIDTTCPVCMSADTCTQEIMLYPDTGAVVVVHESAPPMEMN